MKILKLASLHLLWLTGLNLQADPTAIFPAPAPLPVADPMTEALPILQTKYADFAALNYKPGDKLSDLIGRSEGKLSLIPADTPTPVSIITASLPDGILYWRMASFALPPQKTWPDLVAQLKQADVRGIILDLRSNTAPDDFAGASQLRSFFGPVCVSTTPRTDIKPDPEPITSLFPFPTVVLTNHQTTGAAEALAGYLQADGAIVVGRPTAGKVALFQEAKLSTGQTLRFTVSASGKDDPIGAFKFRSEAPTWGHPVMPDISPTIDEHAEKVALTLIKDDHVLDVIEESPARHRLCEASLVGGNDPEWDDYLASLEDKPVLLSLPTVHDTALISALDSLKAIQLSQRTVPTQAPADASAPVSTSIQ